MSQPMTLEENSTFTEPRFVRKRYPLINLHLPVVFELHAGEFKLDTAEISHEELRVNCPAAQIPKLVPRTAHHRPDEKIHHRALLKLDNDELLNLQLEVSFCRRYSQKEFKVGFRFKDISEELQRKLQFRLEEALSQNAQPASIIN